MTDISLKEALLLWNSGLNGGTPAFVVRPLGHDDYDRFDYQGGACYRVWRDAADKSKPDLLARAMVDLWHVAAFYAVPIGAIHEAMLAVPEYRAMLADDVLPVKFQHERS